MSRFRKPVRCFSTVRLAWSSSVVWNLFISCSSWISCASALVELLSSWKWRCRSHSEVANVLWLRMYSLPLSTATLHALMIFSSRTSRCSISASSCSIRSRKVGESLRHSPKSILQRAIVRGCLGEDRTRPPVQYYCGRSSAKKLATHICTNIHTHI
uniref:Putative secreted peptide n=1 Tax=Anopheles braziliensis TaxID=58242 RepID=A0A2M3ZRN2_9DIPT